MSLVAGKDTDLLVNLLFFVGFDLMRAINFRIQRENLNFFGETYENTLIKVLNSDDQDLINKFTALTLAHKKGDLCTPTRFFVAIDKVMISIGTREFNCLSSVEYFVSEVTSRFFTKDISDHFDILIGMAPVFPHLLLTLSNCREWGQNIVEELNFCAQNYVKMRKMSAVEVGFLKRGMKEMTNLVLRRSRLE